MRKGVRQGRPESTGPMWKSQPCAVLRRRGKFPGLREEIYGSDVSAAQSATHQQAWVSRAHENGVGTRDTVAPPQEGTQTPRAPSAVEAPEPLTRQRYPRALRLSRGTELTSCWETGRRRRTPLLELAWRHNSLGHARIGLIVPRFGGSAVARNRVRRRLREIARRDVLHQLPPIDLVIRANRSAYAASFAALRAELTAAAGTLA